MALAPPTSSAPSDRNLESARASEDSDLASEVAVLRCSADSVESTELRLSSAPTARSSSESDEPTIVRLICSGRAVTSKRACANRAWSP